MATQTFTSKSSDWQRNVQGFQLTLHNPYSLFFQVSAYPIREDHFNGTLVMERVTAEDLLWDNLFADPRSEALLLAFASEAREAEEIELWSLEDSGL